MRSPLDMGSAIWTNRRSSDRKVRQSPGPGTILTTILHGGRALIDALFPCVCFDCDRLFATPSSRSGKDRIEIDADCHFPRLMSGYLCSACRSRYKAIQSPMCRRCGLPFESPHGHDHLCSSCASQPPSFIEARAAGSYQGPLRRTIHQLKYHGRETLARPLGRLLWETLCQYWTPDQFDRVVPVPLALAVSSIISAVSIPEYSYRCNPRLVLFEYGPTDRVDDSEAPATL